MKIKPVYKYSNLIKGSSVSCPKCGSFKYFKYRLCHKLIKGKGYCHRCYCISDLPK